MNQTFPYDKVCADCPCARSVAEYARRKGLSFARAKAALEQQMQGRPLEGIGPVEICPCTPDRAAACPVFALVRRLAAGCGLEPAQWLETADVLIDGEYEGRARDVSDEEPAPVPAAPDPAMPQPDVSGDMPGDTSDSPAPGPWAAIRARWKLWLACAGAALVLALGMWGAWKLGYAASLEANGTYADGYAAAKAEGTFEEGRAAGYEEGYQTGYTEGLQEGFDQGKSTGYSEGYSDGSADVQQAHSDAQQAMDEVENNRRATRVWTPWLGSTYHLDPDCPRLWGGEETTLGEAEDAGYSPCSRCAKN